MAETGDGDRGRFLVSFLLLSAWNAHLIHRGTVPLPLKGKACLVVSAKVYFRTRCTY